MFKKYFIRNHPFFQVSSKVIDIQVPAAFEAEKKEFICQMAEFGIHLENVDCVFTTDSKNKRSWLCPGNNSELNSLVKIN